MWYNQKQTNTFWNVCKICDLSRMCPASFPMTAGIHSNTPAPRLRRSVSVNRWIGCLQEWNRLLVSFVNVRVSYFKQISRLTWFTRFDTMESKEHVFTVEQDSKNLEMNTGRVDEMVGEQESGDGKSFHHRKGGSLPCLLWFLCYSRWCTHQTSVFSHRLVNSPDSSSSVSSVRSQSRLMSALYWLCGMEKRKEGDNNVTPPAPEQAICSLDEKPRLKLIVNVNLIICISVTAFIIGFWAWQAWYRITLSLWHQHTV